MPALTGPVPALRLLVDGPAHAPIIVRDFAGGAPSAETVLTAAPPMGDERKTRGRTRPSLLSR